MDVGWRLRGWPAVVAIVALTGCAGMRGASDAGAAVRPATDVPDHFMVATATGAAEPRPDDGCRNPIVDPRDGARLTLIRSAEGRGDYEPQSPGSRYGLRQGELLRVECASGVPVGIVRR